jgi:hypothetical protein
MIVNDSKERKDRLKKKDIDSPVKIRQPLKTLWLGIINDILKAS